VNVTLIVQVAGLGPRVLPQVVLATAKSAALVPANPILAMFKVALPVLLRRIAAGELVVPTPWGPKGGGGAEGVERLAEGAPPVPVRLTVCVLLGVSLLLSVIVTAAVKVPAEVGLNATVIVQMPFAARVLGLTGQLLV
jgi:hypothetical protein